MDKKMKNFVKLVNCLGSEHEENHIYGMGRESQDNFYDVEHV